MLASLFARFLRVIFVVYRWLRSVYDVVFVEEITANKIPRHLTVAVKAPKFASPKQIVDLVGYARNFGIPELTIYNTCNWKQALDDLSDVIGTNVLIISENESVHIDHDGVVAIVDTVSISDQFVLRMIPFDYEQRSGLKDFLVDNPEPNKTIRDKWQLHNNGLPDLVLICDGAVAFNSISLSGFPSWLLKTAELGSLPDLDTVRKGHLYRELVKYSKSTQKFGH